MSTTFSWEAQVYLLFQIIKINTSRINDSQYFYHQSINTCCDFQDPSNQDYYVNRANNVDYFFGHVVTIEGVSNKYYHSKKKFSVEN